MAEPKSIHQRPALGSLHHARQRASQGHDVVRRRVSGGDKRNRRALRRVGKPSQSHEGFWPIITEKRVGEASIEAASAPPEATSCILMAWLPVSTTRLKKRDPPAIRANMTRGRFMPEFE